MTERMHLSVTHRADGDDGHVERIEGGVIVGEDEADRAARNDDEQRDNDQQQPVAKALHASAIVARAMSRLDVAQPFSPALPFLWGGLFSPLPRGERTPVPPVRKLLTM